jgi:cytidylate kinase
MSACVTISASFGAGGNVVGPAVAEALGLPFFDRAIPVAVAQRLSVPLDSVIATDEKGPTGWERLAQSFASVTPLLGAASMVEDVYNPDRFREETEAIVRATAASTGGVFLGRAGMIVLADRPDVLCVRLDGPVDKRIAQVASEGVSEDEARAMQKDVDGAREAYVRVFYGARQSDPSLYHVILDSTALPFDVCADIIVTAAKGRLHLARSASTNP